jgi:hypothetical protein
MNFSDPTVQAALIVGVTAVAAGLIGGWVGGRAATNATRLNIDDAAKARAEAREEARLQRYADQRRQLLTDLWIACDRHKQEVEAQVEARRKVDEGQTPTGWPGVNSVEPARQTYLALTLLVGPEVGVRAAALLAATDALSVNHAQIEGQTRAFYAVDDDGWGRDLAAWTDASLRYAEWASENLQGPFDHD